MTIEEKAKAYDEALKVIKDNLDALNEIIETGAEIVSVQAIKYCFYRAFPELKESEDEKIRKAIVEFFKLQDDNTTYSLIPKKSILAWLEKQKEQKPAEWSEEDERMLRLIRNAFKNGAMSTIGQDQWLKSLPERFNLQPKNEWSEEDERIRKELICYLNEMENCGGVVSFNGFSIKEYITYLEKQKEK